jgi:hypothetical protein
MNKKILAFVTLATLATPAFSAATIITAAVIGGSLYAGASIAVAIAIGIVASAVISKAFQVPTGYDPSGASSNLGNRQQIPPATDNKLPVVYGSAWLGGTVTDLSITSDNQVIYYVMALCEVTNTPSSAPDTITFGDVYWGGKKCVFDTVDATKVNQLLDESTGETEQIDGKIKIYLYRNGSNSPANSAQSAISVMQDSNLIYKWDSTKLMSNCAFAIVRLEYNSDAGTTSLQQTKFKINNSRYQVGDCFYDYLTNTRYGCAIPLSQINNASLSELNSYANENFTYTTYNGVTTTQARFRFDGVIETNRVVMSNLQDMASCCDCLIKYNEITAQWGVIVQKPTYDVAMEINDSNMVSAISISPIDLAGSYNIAEVKYPDSTNQDAFASATYDLAQIDPSLLLPNEPVNKQTINLPLVNNDVRAQYLVNRFLKSAREDLQVQVTVNFVGIQLEAGDIVTVTNSNYGWVDKPFRVNRVTESFADDGAVTAKLNLSEFNATVYDDVPITQFTPASNTGISSPTTFGTVPAPVISSQQPNSANPSFNVSVTTSSGGISQYAEVWYSAFANPTDSQRIFAGTTAIQSSGTPYAPNTVIPDVTLNNIPSGNWYFFSRMVNSLANSQFSPASTLFAWKPTTAQYAQRWLVVAYADSVTGSGFTTNPRNKSYYGLVNASTSTPISNPALYTWYLANPTFGTDNYLLFNNRTGRRFSFATGTAGYAGGTGAYVPTQTDIYDPSTWSALPDGTNYIDLDRRTGQLTETGTTTVGTGEIQVKNNADGRIVASLAAIPALQSLAGGAGTYTATVAKLTIDIYGRVLGFEPPDDFDYTTQQFNAASGQTVFTVTRGSDYLINNCFVFQNGVLLDESDYTDTGGSTGTVTLDTGALLGDIITIISMKSVNLITGVYNSFTREVVSLTAASEYTASGFTLVSGYELLFLNGTVVNDQDYDIVGQTITNFPDLVTGELTIIQWSNNNLNIQNGSPINEVTNSVIGQDTYPFSYVADALNIYQNGVLLDSDTDYTAGFGAYTLSNTPTDINQILLQQTFNRTGAV